MSVRFRRPTCELLASHALRSLERDRIITLTPRGRRLLRGCADRGLAGPLDFLDKLFAKKKPKPRVGDKTIYWFPGPGKGASPMTKRGYGVMGGARRRRRRRR